MNILNRLAPHVHWVPRIALAGIFVPQGYSKFLYPGMIPPPLWQVVGVLEILGAIGIIWGAFGRDLLTRLGGLVFLIVMIGAGIALYQPMGSSYSPGAPRIWVGPLGGLEFNALTAALAVYFLVKGNGVGEQVLRRGEQR